MAETTSIESSLHEDRLFPPPAGFSESVGGAWISSLDEYTRLHERSIRDPEGFWGEIAADFVWFEPWRQVLEWNLPDARWFVGGRTNICHNCLDRQIDRGHGDETALVWEGEPMDGATPEIRTFTYRDLHREVCRFAHALRSLGVGKGDIVTIYLGMVPELAIAMLACARIGAPHSVIFAGFSAQAIADRVADAQSRTVITADGAWRRGGVVPLKANVDEAIRKVGVVERVVVVRRTGGEVAWTDGRDRWWHDLVEGAEETCPAEPMDSEAMLFLLYTGQLFWGDRIDHDA